MGCTTGHLACQPQPQTSGQDGQSLEAGGAKVPEVLSSLERLSQATGGMEKSWYRCIFPFGIISLVIGVAGTGVTYTYNDLPQTKVVSVVLLIMGVLLLLMATACWTVHKKKRRKKKEGGSFTSEQCPLWSTGERVIRTWKQRHTQSWELNGWLKNPSLNLLLAPSILYHKVWYSSYWRILGLRNYRERKDRQDTEDQFSLWGLDHFGLAKKGSPMLHTLFYHQ